MKFLVFIFLIGILISLNCFKNKKIKNLCTLAIIFSLLVGCNSSKSESIIDKSSSGESTIDNTYELSDEEVDEDYEEDEETSENNQIIHENDEISDDHRYEHEDNSHEDSHIGETVYIANGNSYYHKISNCKYLEGAKTKKVVLSSDMQKYECNCFTNPVEYNPDSGHHSEKHHSNKNHSSGQKVYIAKGNSYYHKSANCKFIKGADVSKVDISDVGGKHPCNCIKY